MKATILVLVLLCAVGCSGDSRKTYHVHDDGLLPYAVHAQGLFNMLFNCRLVEVVSDDAEPALRNGVQEMFFTEDMNAGFAGFTHSESPSEHDIMIRPKSEVVEVNGRTFKRPPPDYTGTVLHELGHSYGLEHSERMDDIMHPAGADYTDEAARERFKAALVAGGVQCPRK